MTQARDIANLLDANGQIDNADIANNTIANAKLAQTPNFRNIIINGDMSIAQRGTSATGLGDGNNGYHTCDRWKFNEGASPTFEFTQSQSTDVPTGQGFATSLKMDCTTADASLASGVNLSIQQLIEGQNLQYLKKGTSSAESTTMSFWVKSAKTGTYIVELYDENDRDISKAYTISSANTWEKKTLTFAGDTSGALGNDNGVGLYCVFWLCAGTDYTSGTLNTSWNSATNANRAVGQVNLSDSTSNDFYITGVQLEAGTTASEFEFLPVDVNLQRCFRYYQVFIDGNSQLLGFGNYYTTDNLRAFGEFLTPMRAIPSLEVSDVTDNFRFLRVSASDYVNDFTLNGNTTTRIWGIINTADASGAAGATGYIQSNSADSYLAFDGEL